MVENTTAAAPGKPAPRSSYRAAAAAHPVQHLLFPLFVEHGQMMRRLIGGHLQGTIHPAAEKGDQLVVQTVDFGTDIGKFHGRIIPFQSVGAVGWDGLGLQNIQQAQGQAASATGRARGTMQGS